jgi:hypothetical protein
MEWCGGFVNSSLKMLMRRIEGLEGIEELKESERLKETEFMKEIEERLQGLKICFDTRSEDRCIA